MAKINYNERSWAIDVISEINLFLASKSWHFKSAGGENTISIDKSSLFPDILIFRDRSKEVILQGWELKMPDTPINDPELINNAIKKATILQRDSFILWNVKSAVLYFKNNGTYSILKSWNEIAINNRLEVKQNENLWKTLLHTILEDLNNYFDSGDISDDVVYDILAIDTIIDVILENISSTIENLKVKTRSSARLDAQINNWWLSSATEYGFNSTAAKDRSNKFPTLSKVILTDWVFKIIFANILKRHLNEAKAIEAIDFGTTINDAKIIVSNISTHCNFWNIFGDNLAIEQISETAWKQIIQLNQFFATINIEGIEIEILHNLLQTSIASAKRKVAGQFATPRKLADLLTRLTMDDKHGDVIDPCCGTGTIIKQAYILKEEYEIPKDEIIESIWASDKQSFPIQLSTLTLAKPDNIGKILNIFKSDVIDLKVGQNISFKDPNNGNEIQKTLPLFNYILSNLPFIKNKDIKVLNPDITAINSYIKKHSGSNKCLSKKSDIYSYIPFYLHQILKADGKIGLILSNSWLGTDYGEIFLELFQKFYDIDIIGISGKGKWFKNAHVVTTFLIASKKNPSNQENDKKEISFCTLKVKIDDISDVKKLSEDIILDLRTEELNIQKYSTTQISRLESIGIPWCGYFANLKWLPEISNKLTKCNSFFNFTRGERRGWNALFYPFAGHKIEPEYIKPVLRNLKGTTSLTCVADAEAFCCSRTIAELKSLHHNGALNWIKSFENQNNETGIPLTTSLRRANMHWYEMKTENMADFVANVNYDRSLFIANFKSRSFIDQRMIGISIKPHAQLEDKSLFLALFNSVISMFFIESFGFGRGLGALDLRETKFKRDYKILNPNLLTAEKKQEIIIAFSPLTRRNRLPLLQELFQKDRINFEKVLFDAFEISEHYDSIKESLIHLYTIRFSVKD